MTQTLDFAPSFAPTLAPSLGQSGSAFQAGQRQLCRGTVVEQITQLREWMPVSIAQDSGAMVWRWIGEKRFTEPFFADALQGQAREQRQVHYSAPAQTAQLIANMPHLSPTAFIFHCSRCGSTLLMQLLACLPHCIAMSEPPVIDACLEYAQQHPEQPETAIGLLRDAVAALGQQRFAAEQHLLIKLDSWHICQLPLLRAAFPHTQFYFLYRQPEAVLASHQRQPGPQMVPGMIALERLGLSPSQIVHGAAWCDLLLQRFFQLAREYAAQLQLLHYQQLPGLLWQQLLAEWQIAITPEQLASMQQRSGLHAKSLQGFQGDPAPAQQVQASQALHDLYQALQQARQSAGISAGI